PVARSSARAASSRAVTARRARSTRATAAGADGAAPARGACHPALEAQDRRMVMGARASGAWIAAALALCALGCAGDDDHLAEIAAEGEPVEPPFEVRGEAEGLLLVWFDEEGLHTASRRSEIPEAHRDAVRVDDLSLAPEERLDPELVYVAD